MSNGIYVACSGSVAIEKNMETVANNLANVTTVGFKKGKAIFSDYIHDYKNPDVPLKQAENGTPQDKFFTEIDTVHNDFTVGSYKETGNPLDLAITGDAFFKVQEGEQILLQRGGVFTIATDGSITAQDGAQLLDAAGAPIVVDPQKAIHIDEAGGLWQAEQKLTDIGLATVDNKAWLEKVGDTRWKISGDGKEIQAEKGGVLQGYTESSNVNAVAELVEMIKVNRHYDTAAKAIKSYQDMDDRAINKVGAI